MSYPVYVSALFCALFCTTLLLYVPGYGQSKHGRIIILNGVSSSGKSTLQKEFCQQMPDLFLSFGIDTLFVGPLPSKVFAPLTPEQIEQRDFVMRVINSVDDDGSPVVTLDVGNRGHTVITGMIDAIVAYAAAGNNVIVDYINYYPAWREALIAKLAPYKPVYVGVNISLAEVERREKARGTSPVGHARSHFHNVHEGFTYDVQVNSETQTSAQAALDIVKYLQKSS